MFILGINAFHGDSSACILKNGSLIAASEEERFTRVKHWAGFPAQAIKFCLEEAHVNIREIEYVTISRDPSANLHKKIIHSLGNFVQLKALRDRFSNSRKVINIKSELARICGVNESEIPAQIKNIEHHRSHMASTFFASPYQEAAILSIDGFGDFTSTMTGIGKKTKIEILDSVIYPHSLGLFYTTFTQYLGFPHYGDEYKVMGLAPYGDPVHLEKLKDVLLFKSNGLFELNLKYFKHAKEGVNMNWDGGCPSIEPIYSDYLIEKFGPLRRKDEELTKYHKDLAASVQRITEELYFHVLNDLYERTGYSNLCIAGGVAQNSVANGKILDNTLFKDVYIPSAGHDAGTAIGSALYLFNHILNKPRVKEIKTASWGSQFNNNSIEEILKEYDLEDYKKHSEQEINSLVVDCIINGGVVGWFQGRAEFGPRALGHRSILADPRRSDAKDILNLKIKRRESFRPFAPSILKEFVSDFFERDDHVPFMEKVLKIKKDKQGIIPAVTHVDGTGRLQTIDKEAEPKYYSLISEFYKKTGVPILLNTSFNENEPIVNTPQEAIDCFLRTAMDMLVLEDWVISRK